MNWPVRKITIDWNGNPLAIEARVNPAGTLAYHKARHNFDESRTQRGRWNVTHVKTGFAILYLACDEKFAKRVSLELDAKADWSFKNGRSKAAAPAREAARDIYQANPMRIA